MQNFSEQDMEKMMERAITKMFAAEDSQGGNRFVNVSRVPLICQSILAINGRLKSIEANMTWGVRIVIGAVILALIALLIKK